MLWTLFWGYPSLNIYLPPTCFESCMDIYIYIYHWLSTTIAHLRPARSHGPLTRYAELRVARAPGMPGTFIQPPRVSDPDTHHGTCVTHVPWCMPGSLTSGFRWSWWRGKRSRHSRRMRNQQFCVSGKRPIAKTNSIDPCPWMSSGQFLL